MPGREEAIWAGGFFDGEGSTGCYRSGAPVSTAPRMQVTISQTNRSLLVKFQKAVGGFGSISKPRRPKPHVRRIWIWKCHNIADVVRVLATIWPHIGSIKRQQALTARHKYFAYPRRCRIRRRMA